MRCWEEEAGSMMREWGRCGRYIYWISEGFRGSVVLMLGVVGTFFPFQIDLACEGRRGFVK